MMIVPNREIQIQTVAQARVIPSTRISITAAWIVAWVTLTTGLGAVASPLHYQLIPLPSPTPNPDGSFSGWGLGINNHGQAVGHASLFQSFDSQPSWGIVWSPEGAVDAILEPLSNYNGPLSRSSGRAVNDAGIVVGSAFQPGPTISRGSRAAYWLPGSETPIELPNLGLNINGHTAAGANAINTNGIIVGDATKHDDEMDSLGGRAVRWDTAAQTMTELGLLGAAASGHSSAEAFGVNDAGTIVGTALFYSNGGARGRRAVRWEAGSNTAVRLGDLGTDLSGRTKSYALGINNTGDAVGYADTYDGDTYLGRRAVRWNAGSTQPIEMDHRGLNSAGFTNAGVSDINDQGQAVGSADVYDEMGQRLPGGSASFWDTDGTVYGLADWVVNLDGWSLFSANDISETGYIIGRGDDPDGNDVPFLLIPLPVPEPTTISLAMVLLMGIAIRQRRRV